MLRHLPRTRCAAVSAGRWRIMKIKTIYVYPPIPIRDFDWAAYDADTYDGVSGKVGFGATKEQAIRELEEILRQDADAEEVCRLGDCCPRCGEIGRASCRERG